MADLRHLPAQDLLEIRLDDPGDTSGAEAEPVLVPFVRELVPQVDLDAGWLAVAPVPGLLAAADPDDPEDAGGSGDPAASGTVGEQD